MESGAATVSKIDHFNLIGNKSRQAETQTMASFMLYIPQSNFHCSLLRI
jgi:hypothetical protein